MSTQQKVELVEEAKEQHGLNQTLQTLGPRHRLEQGKLRL